MAERTAEDRKPTRPRKDVKSHQDILALIDSTLAACASPPPGVALDLRK